MNQRSRITPVILAGGAGERLWPISKADFPKPFALRDAQGRSLFQATLLRVADRAMFAPPLVLCHHEHRFIVAEQLRLLGIADAVILLEPTARNTAPAIALAAQFAPPDATLLVLPADHAIADHAAFLETTRNAQRAVAEGYIVTFGIAPTRPEEGYGYIRRGQALTEHACTIHSFYEKPEAEMAERFIADGDYFWNSGIFFALARTLKRELETHCPAIMQATQNALWAHEADGDYILLPSAPLSQCESISFDVAVMQRTARGAMVEATFDWSDLGSFASLAQLMPLDEAGNRVLGQALLGGVKRSIIHSDGPLIAAIGLSDVVIIAVDGAVLVAPQNQLGMLKPMLEEMRAQAIGDTHLKAKCYRPWGSYTVLHKGRNYQVKQLSIAPGLGISLQRHRHRAEHWVVVRGVATVTRDTSISILRENESIDIAPGQVHRLSNETTQPLTVIEVQTGSYLGEDDIERLEEREAAD